jgi:hypothetical protein
LVKIPLENEIKMIVSIIINLETTKEKLRDYKIKLFLKLDEMTIFQFLSFKNAIIEFLNDLEGVNDKLRIEMESKIKILSQQRCFHPRDKLRSNHYG